MGIKILRPRSIQTSMILSFLALIVIIVLALSMASYRYTIRDFEELSLNNTAQLLGEINYSIDSYVDNMKSMAAVVVENGDVRRLMRFFNTHQDNALTIAQQEERDMLRQRAAAHMNVVAKTRSDITNISVISKYGDVVLHDTEKTVNPHSDYRVSDWFLRPLSYRDEMFVSPSHVQRLIQGEYRWVISISKAIIDPVDNEVTGVMVIDLNYRSIEAICENINMQQLGYIYLVDAKKNLIYHPQQHLVYSGIKNEDFDRVLGMAPGQAYLRNDEEDRLYIKNTSLTTGWSAVGVINTQNLIRDRASIIRFYVGIAYIAISLAMTAAILISASITRPVRQLESSMHKVEQGDLTVRSGINSENEIGHLSKTFDAMVERLRRLLERAVANEEEKRRSEIKALQAQINPHFLYNTLDTIIWMSARGKTQEVVEVTTALAHLFRTSISQGDSLVELALEIKNIESYLTIQKMRYKDKLTYRVETSPDALRVMTPKLILQPIVENAVYHGVKLSETGGVIQIRSFLAGDELHIVVEDSGVGMDEEQLARVFQPRVDSARGIGIQNVHSRIQLVFGAAYGLEYQSEKGMGTRVLIRMPATERGDLHA